MTKHGGRYYLQYGAPGTEFNVYANGTYVSDKPLGPFKYARLQSGRLQARRLRPRRRPRLDLPGRARQLVEHAARRGSATTGRSSGGSTCSRRSSTPTGRWLVLVALRRFPALCADQRRSTIPNSLFTGWMLLVLPQGRVRPHRRMGEFAADRVTDEDPRTFWVAAANTARRDADGRSRQDRYGARGAGQFRRLQVRPLRRRARHLHRVRRCKARSTVGHWQAAGAHRAAAPRPPQRLFRAAAAGARALRPLRARSRRRRQSRDQRHPRVRQCRWAGAGNAERTSGGIAPLRPARRDDPLGEGAGRGRLQHPLRHPARPADPDAPTLGRRARQWRDARQRSCARSTSACPIGSRSKRSTKAACRSSAASSRSARASRR